MDSLKPTSYFIVAELSRANHCFEKLLNRGGSQLQGQKIYEEISSGAEAMLDTLALTDPEEATRIFKACPWYFDEMIDDNEVYLGKGIFIERSMLSTLDSPEKRAAYIHDV